MKVTKISIDELSVIKASIIESQKKHTKGTVMYSIYQEIINKVATLSESKGSCGSTELIVLSMELTEARDMMQDIQTVAITEPKTDRKVQVLKFVSDVWNKIFENKKSLFERNY